MVTKKAAKWGTVKLVRPSGKKPSKATKSKGVQNPVKLEKGVWEEADLWHKERNGVRCDLCSVGCFVSKDKMGACGLRKNMENRMFTMNNSVKAMVVDSVEKRPLFHFLPGAKSLSISGEAKEDWRIEHDRLPKINKSLTSEQVVKMAEKEKAKVISYTYGESALFFEYMYKTARLAHRSSIKNVLSTNGIITDESVKKVAKFMDAAVINIQASGDPDFMSGHHVIKDLKPVYRSMKQLKKQRVHMEITNTIVPQIGDSVDRCRELAEHIVANLESTIPFHILQFHPNNKLSDLPFTPMSTLEECANIARRAGLRYVYVGNVIEPHQGENTFCYNCREMIMQRSNGVLKVNDLQNDRCPECGVKIDVVIQ